MFALHIISSDMEESIWKMTDKSTLMTDDASWSHFHPPFFHYKRCTIFQTCGMVYNDARSIPSIITCVPGLNTVPEAQAGGWPKFHLDFEIQAQGLLNPGQIAVLAGTGLSWPKLHHLMELLADSRYIRCTSMDTFQNILPVIFCINSMILTNLKELQVLYYSSQYLSIYFVIRGLIMVFTA